MNNPKYRQKWILDVLKYEPTTTFKNMFSKYSDKFSGLSEVTFNKDWKTAQIELKEYLHLIESEKLKESIKTEKEAVRRNILDKIDVMGFLSNIIQDKNEKTSDRLKAVVEFSKMNGWYAPEKIEDVTGKHITFEVITTKDRLKD